MKLNDLASEKGHTRVCSITDRRLQRWGFAFRNGHQYLELCPKQAEKMLDEVDNPGELENALKRMRSARVFRVTVTMLTNAENRLCAAVDQFKDEVFGGTPTAQVAGFIREWPLLLSEKNESLTWREAHRRLESVLKRLPTFRPTPLERVVNQQSYYMRLRRHLKEVDTALAFFKENQEAAGKAKQSYLARKSSLEDPSDTQDEQAVDDEHQPQTLPWETEEANP